MKTIDEVFELIEIREDAGDAVLSWQHGPSWKLAEAEKMYVDATKELRAAIEELAADAEKWHEDFECPTCGEVNPSTSCGSPNCGLLLGGTP